MNSEVELRIIDKVDSIASELKGLAVEIHDNPELGLQEYEACKLHTDLLKKYGFDVTIGAAGYETAFVATHKGNKEGPVIVFLAEYDALPGLGHGCGHNLVGTVATGAGIAVKDIVDEFGGEVRVYGTPAEETVGSKVDFIRKGMFDDCDVVMMAHPSYFNADGMNTLAMRNMRVEFFGKAAHAGSVPDKGINALDAMISLYNMINAYRQQMPSDAKVHGIITNGGEAPNIVPAYTSAIFYMRANERNECKFIYDRVTDMVKAAALGTGCTYKISAAENVLDDTVTNYALAGLITKRLESFGVKIHKTKGEHISVSSDLGNVSRTLPSVQMMFCIGVPDSGEVTEAHTVGFARDAISEMALSNMITFIKAFAMATHDIITEEGVLDSIKKEFRETVG